MKNNCRKKAFTLVELLVVVLIIGILAAVALPQYQKATERAKATEALVVLKAVIQGAEAYHLANGTWPTKFDELAVDIPWTGNQKGTTDGNVKDVRSNKNWALEMYIPPASFSMHRVYLTRINNNRYKGVVISYAFQNQEEDIEKIAFCVERSGTFPGNTGDYCSKILHAQKIGNTARYKLTF